jgi:hypothetical protein
MTRQALRPATPAAMGKISLAGLGNRARREINGAKAMATKRGSEIEVGDVIYVGIGNRTGRVQEFKPHPQLAERNPGLTGRVAVTDRGSITVIDQEPTRVPG